MYIDGYIHTEESNEFLIRDHCIEPVCGELAREFGRTEIFKEYGIFLYKRKFYSFEPIGHYYGYGKSNLYGNIKPCENPPYSLKVLNNFFECDIKERIDNDGTPKLLVDIFEDGIYREGVVPFYTDENIHALVEAFRGDSKVIRIETSDFAYGIDEEWDEINYWETLVSFLEKSKETTILGKRYNSFLRCEYIDFLFDGKKIIASHWGEDLSEQMTIELLHEDYEQYNK